MALLNSAEPCEELRNHLGIVILQSSSMTQIHLPAHNQRHSLFEPLAGACFQPLLKIQKLCTGILSWCAMLL